MAGVPALSSLPGAAHTIYLDFDGHTVQNTHWNSYYNQSTLVAKPFDIDGNPSTFSAAELARIEEAWQRVSEDYAPFNVNVTTVDPGVDALRKTSAPDTRWGVRVIVTNESTMVTNPSERTGAGGIAYVDSFTWNSDTPAWVFTTGGKSIAEAASHEVGHALGLEHDGTASRGYYAGHGSGETGWAPVMGVGYSRNVTQWDNGTYAGTNNGGTSANFGSGADDLAVILAGNGFGYRTDDHGNTSGTATKLSLSGNTVSASGLIERSADVDVFSFSTGGGNVSLQVRPYAVGTNLDVRADLYNSAGLKIASSNPSTALDASLSLNLTAGTYYLHVDGVGSANYSDYGSIGRYTVSGTIAQPTSTPSADSTAASFSVSDAVVSEDGRTAVFEVTLTGDISAPASVVFATANGTAVAGKDFTSKAVKLTFQPGGAKVGRVSVAIANDRTIEANEQFFVNLSKATGATISDARGVGTITDNDASALPSSISISSISSTEGNATTGKKFYFGVTLDRPSSQTVSVRYTTADGSATAASGDYRATAGTLRFAPGETTKYISVTVYGDRVREGHEAFLVLLSHPVGATISSTYAMGTLLNEDTSFAAAAAPEPIVDPIAYFEEEGAQNHHEHDHAAPTFDVAATSVSALLSSDGDVDHVSPIAAAHRTQHGTDSLDAACDARQHDNASLRSNTEHSALGDKIGAAVRREIAGASVAPRGDKVDEVMNLLDEWLDVFDSNFA
jgi:hypothetical protein